MAIINLYTEIQLSQEEEEDKVLTIVIPLFKDLYTELMLNVPQLQKEVSEFNPDWIVESSGFDPALVWCDWACEGWGAGFTFDLTIRSPDGDRQSDYLISEFEEWKKLGEPLYQDVFEPLQKFSWQGFKREGVDVKFSAIKVVHKYNGRGYHIYNNKGWL